MAKVEIKPHGGYTDILVDGKTMNNIVSYAIRQQVGVEVPVVEIKLYGHENEYLLENANVHLHITPDSLQSAVAIVRNELLKQGDFYKSFLASIESAIREKVDSEELWLCDISIDTDSWATTVLDRIVGLEGANGSD